MHIIRANYKGINLVGGYQFWSNPGLFETEGAIPVILARPTLLDLIRLVARYGSDRIEQANQSLFERGEIAPLHYENNLRRLRSIRSATHDQP